MPSYEITQKLGLLNTYTGMILPLIASASATFFFRQFFLSVPEELVEAARIDRAGPIRFFFDILVPLSRTMIAAIFIIMFVYGWNQYLWPVMVVTNESKYTPVQGIKQITQGLEGNSTPEYGRSNLLGLRPEDFVVDRAGALVMRVDIVDELGARKLAHGQLGQQRLVIEMAKGFALPRGEIRVAIAPGALCVFSAENGLRLAAPVTRDERVLEPA